MAYMSVKYAVNKYGTGFPNATLAEHYGEHIINIKFNSDTANGQFVAADVDNAWPEFDVFAEKAVTSFKGIVEQKMTNGKWLVLVTDPGDALFVYQKPLTGYETPRELTREEAFYNPAGSIGRCYKLAAFDRIEISEDNFEGTPEAGAKINGVTSKKATIASAEGQTGAQGETGAEGQTN